MATDDHSEHQTIEKPRSLWPWIFLALWFIWLGAMIFMSWPELMRNRPAHPENSANPVTRTRDFEKR